MVIAGVIAHITGNQAELCLVDFLRKKEFGEGKKGSPHLFPSLS